MDINKELHDRIEVQNLWDKSLVLPRYGYLKMEGTIDTNLYYIMSGSLKISIYSGEEEYIIRFGYRSEFITSIDSFITERKSDFIIQAIKKTQLKVISKVNYMNFIHSHPDNKALWDVALEQLIVQQLEREKDILMSSPKERYQRVLARSPRLFQEIPNKYIASYLRMTPETLSRLKKS